MKKEILVVEDEKISYLFLAHHLNDLGHRIVGSAVTGEEAITKASEFQPDLVVMDVGLKGAMSGTEAVGGRKSAFHCLFSYSIITAIWA